MVSTTLPVFTTSVRTLGKSSCPRVKRNTSKARAATTEITMTILRLLVFFVRRSFISKAAFSLLSGLKSILSGESSVFLFIFANVSLTYLSVVEAVTV